MIDKKKQESMDDAMLALRERLKGVSEKLRMSRQASNDALRRDDLPERLPGRAGNRPVSHSDFIPTRLPADMWPDFLRKLSVRFEAVAADTESDFLSMGANLYEFQRMSKKISETAGYVAGLIADREIGNSIEELKWVISRMREWLYSSEAATSMTHEQLNARMLVDKTGICLNTLEKKYMRSEYILRDFTDKTGEINASISSVIESLQYSDITRQHISHIKEEVDLLEARLSDHGFGSTVTDISVLRETVGEAGGTCMVLASELRKTIAEFDRAVRAVSDNLLTVSKDTAEMSEDIMQVVKGDSESGKSFMSAIGNWLSSLTDTLSTFRVDGERCASLATAAGAPASEIPEEFRNMVGELCAVVESLRKVNGNILYRLSLMEDESKVLSQEVAAAVDRFGSNSRVSSMGEGIAAGLDKLAEEARSIASERVDRHHTILRARYRPGFGFGHGGAGSRTEAPRGDAAQDGNVELF